MATYIPPTEDFSYPNSFNPIVFRSADDSISIAEGDTRYLRFPVSQGSETIDGNLTITGEAFCATVPSGNTALANKLYVDNAVVGGSILGTNNTWTGTNAFNTFLPTSTQTPTTSTQLTTKTYVDSASVSLLGSNNTWTGTNAFGTMSAGASTLTSVITNTITGTAVGTAVSLYDEASRTGAVSLATGTGTRNINIGGDSSTTSIFGSTCDMGVGSTTAAVNIATNGFFGGTVNIATQGSVSKTVNIGTTTNSTINLIGSAITASLMSIAGTLSAGASTLTSVATSTITTGAPTGFTNLFQNITSGNLNVATSATGGTVFIGQNSPITANTQSVQILSGSQGTGDLWLGNGGARTIRMGGANSTILIGDSTTSTITLGGSTITATKMAIAGVLSAGASTLASASITGLMSSATATVAGALSAGASTLASASITGLMSSATATVAGALSAGASTLTSVITNTITGTAVGTPVSLYSESSRSGAIDIGNGSSRSGDIRIGSGATTTAAVLIGRNGGGVSIGTSGSTNTIDGTTNFDNGTHTVFGTTNINITGTNATSIGNTTGTLSLTGATNTILGTTNINTTGSSNTSIGNTTGTVSITGNTTIDPTYTFNMIPTSSIITTVSTTVPAGYLLCDGSAISRSTYARLFGVISTTFGVGDGTTTFNIPNFTGAFLRGNGVRVVGIVTYGSAALGTQQGDQVLEPINEGYWNIDSGGGGSSRQVRARAYIAADPSDTGTAQTTYFDRQGVECRPFNYAVCYYIRY